MSTSPPKQPKLSEKGQDLRREREARLAEALRANLRRRKTQARGRAGTGAEAGGQDAGQDGGQGGGPRDGGEA